MTLVVEKLQGRCLRCAGQATTAETITFALAGSLASHTVLQVWQTNETAHFVYLGNLTGQQQRHQEQQHGTDSITATTATTTFSFAVQPDSIVTFSSWFNGQTKGSVTIPPAAPFPLQVSDDFDSYPVDAEARFFADNGGSFQVAADPFATATATTAGNNNKVLKQWVVQENGVNGWATNVREGKV